MANVEKLVQNYKKSPDSRTFEKIWAETVGMVNPKKYFDPTKARTIDDFNQITREALFEAIKTYNPSAGSTVLSWIRMKMSQFLIKELKKIGREMRIYEGELELDKENLSGDTPQEYTPLSMLDGAELPEEVINSVIQEVRAKLANNILILQVFDLKLVFPEISRHTIHLMVGVSKPTLSKYFNEIKNQCLICFKKYNY